MAGSLWRHRDFRLLWGGQSASLLGSAVSYVALPLVGVVVLGLGPLQMGLIATAGRVPVALVSPLVGSVVERVPRRGLLLAADLTRAVLVGSVPAAAAAGVLSFGQLLVVAAGMGLCAQVFNLGHQTLLPEVIGAADLAEGNGKLEAAQSMAEVGGPGVAAALMGVGGPALAVVVDAASYLVSAACLSRLRVAPAGEGQERGSSTGLRHRLGIFAADTAEGFRYLWADPVLRSLSVSYAALALCAQFQEAIYMLFLVRTVHFDATKIASVFTVAAVVGLGAALASDRIARRWGVGRLIVAGQLSMVLGGALLAAVAGPTVQAAATMLVAETAIGVGLSFYGVGSRTLNQTRIPARLRGRVIGAGRVLTLWSVAIAGIIGGSIGSVIGLRHAMEVGAAGMLLALTVILRPSVWHTRAVPASEQTSNLP